jgi:hypothetical protein
MTTNLYQSSSHTKLSPSTHLGFTRTQHTTFLPNGSFSAARVGSREDKIHQIHMKVRDIIDGLARTVEEKKMVWDHAGRTVEEVNR